MGKPGRPRKTVEKNPENGYYVPAGVIQSDEEMVEHNKLTVVNAKNIMRGEKVTENIQAIIASIGAGVAQVGQRIHLSDTQTVQDTAKRYIMSCYEAGLLPSKQGLARACGVSLTGVTKFMREHPHHDTTAYIEMVYDAFAEMRETAALNGAAHPIVSIFGLKANYGYRENEPVAEVKESPLGEAEDTDTIAKKYLELQG